MPPLRNGIPPKRLDNGLTGQSPIWMHGTREQTRILGQRYHCCPFWTTMYRYLNGPFVDDPWLFDKRLDTLFDSLELQL